MNVNTDLKSGNVVESAWQFAVDTSDNVVDYVKEAEYQAANLTHAVTDAAGSIWQGVVGLFQ